MEMAGLAAATALFAVAAWHIVRVVYELHGARLVTCPDNGRTAAVELDVKYAASHSALGRTAFRLKDCSRWPEKAGCAQPCLGAIEEAPHDCLARAIVGRWYAGKQCAYCRRLFGDIHWHDHAPAVRDANGVTHAWTDLPAETLPEVMATCLPVCWNCHVAETFRRERPDQYVERPPWPPPPLV
jgi:hypothetical protein